MKTKRAPAPVQTINPEIIAELKQLKDKQSLNFAQLARLVGVSKSYMSRAFTGTFRGNAEEFETKALAAIDKASNDRRPLIDIKNTGFLVAEMRDFLATVEHTADIGIAYSPAGIGKTLGSVVYAQEHPLAVHITASKTVSGWRALRDAILDTLPNTRTAKRESRDKLLLRVFRGSNRLLIVDNAHLITETARQWLAYDWHEQTGCGVALIGNEKIVEQWSTNDQHQSRTGLMVEMSAQSSAQELADNTLAALLPAALEDPEARAMAARIVTGKGRVRSLRKHLRLAQELQAERGGTYANALRTANTLLPTNIKLAA